MNRPIFETLKYGLFMLGKSLLFSKQTIDSIYRRSIGHDKIIAWVNGSPMYTTLTPLPLSQAFSNKLATVTLSNLQNKILPHMMDIAITDKCNCNCVHCSFYSSSKKGVYDQKKAKNPLSTDEIKNVIDESLNLGVTSINFVGGEPLLNEDIFKIVSYVDKSHAVCSLFTNGYYLAEKASMLKKAGIMSVKVSIDSSDARTHDSKRNMPGLFDKAIKGIIEANKRNIITAMSCCITKKDVEDGSMAKLIELGKRISVKEIIFFDALPTGKYAHRDDLLNDPPSLASIKKIADIYNRKKDYPGIVLYSYIRSPFSHGCCGGKTYFYVSPYGDISPCDFDHEIIGNIRHKPLHLLWQELTRRESKGCTLLNKH